MLVSIYFLCMLLFDLVLFLSIENIMKYRKTGSCFQVNSDREFHFSPFRFTPHSLKQSAMVCFFISVKTDSTVMD